MLRAHAKINLCLSVSPPLPPDARDEAGRSRGGYHQICSWFVPLALHDELQLTMLAPGQASRYTVEWAADAPKKTPIDWPVEKDLTVRAHRLLSEFLGRGSGSDRVAKPGEDLLPVEMVLRKRIPVGGGLGGGSSDAAAMLLGLKRLFGLSVGMADLLELSRSLGADVAFFLDESLGTQGNTASVPRGAIVEGFGDRLERVDGVQGPVLLLIPPFGCPTGAVYRAYDEAPRELQAEAVRKIVDSSLRNNGTLRPEGLFNDLAAPACRVAPELAEILNRLRAGGVKDVQVTGSGSTLFCLVEGSESGAETRAAALAAKALALCPELIAVATRMV